MLSARLSVIGFRLTGRVVYKSIAPFEVDRASVTFLTDRPQSVRDLCSIKPVHVKTNMGTVDRLVRTVIALAITVLYFSGVLRGTLGIVLLVLAGVFFLTSLVRFCPLYPLFGIRTRKN